MQIAMVGLGRMGANMARRLMAGGHTCVVYDLNKNNVNALVKEGAIGASSFADLAKQMKAPRIVWIMVPAGEATQKTIDELSNVLQAKDIIIDGGNSFYQDDLRRAKVLSEKEINFNDVGTSGGVWGFKRGYCLMIGGDKKSVEYCNAIFRTLAPGEGDIAKTLGQDKGTAVQGYLHCGPVGAGHFVKMVHNGIEYGLMQAYAEGFSVLKGAAQPHIPENRRYDIDMAAVAEVWRRGSVIGSWLLDLSAIALTQDSELKQFTGNVEDSGEGRWTINAAIEEGVPVTVLAASLFTRFRSREQNPFSEKLLSAMRMEFGGHVEKKT